VAGAVPAASATTGLESVTTRLESTTMCVYSSAVDAGLAGETVCTRSGRGRTMLMMARVTERSFKAVDGICEGLVGQRAATGAEAEGRVRAGAALAGAMQGRRASAGIALAGGPGLMPHRR
jgi:hypothetical protein